MGLGIGNCCCSAPSCEACCENLSLFLWFQYSDVEFLEYLCDSCNTTPFQVELESVTPCSESSCCTYLFSDVDYCGDSFGTGNCVGGINMKVPTLNCVSACYEASFSTACIECVPTMGGSAYYTRIDYTLRAQTGIDVTPGTGNGECKTVVGIVEEVYQGDACDALTLRRATLKLGVVTPPGDCCGNVAFAFETDTNIWTNCTITCDTIINSTPPCGAGIAIATVPNPEYGEIEYAC